MLVVGVMCIFRPVFADESAPVLAPQDYSYSVHLYFAPADHTLSIDNTAQFPYDVEAQVFRPRKALDTESYYASVIGMTGETIYTFGFDPEALSLKQEEELRKITVVVPYFGDAKSVDFFFGNVRLASVSLVGSSACNNNQACEADFGENASLCPIECHGTRIIPADFGVIDSTYRDDSDSAVESIPIDGFAVGEGTSPEAVSTTTPRRSLGVLVFFVGLGIVLGFTLYLLLRKRKVSPDVESA